MSKKKNKGIKDNKGDYIPVEELESGSLSFDPVFITEKIITFGEMLTGISIYGYQHQIAFRIIHSVLVNDGESITMLLSRQSGKTEVLSFVSCTLLVIMPILGKMFPELQHLQHGIQIGLFAPQRDQVDTTYGRTLGRIKSQNSQMVMSDPEIATSLTSKAYITLDNGSFMTGQVANKQSKIESKTFHIAIIEEAQDVDSYIVEKSIEPMVAATNGVIIRCGTTGVRKNHFWEEIQFNRLKNRKITDPRLGFHYEFNYKDIIGFKRDQYAIDKKAFHLNYEKTINKLIAKRGSDDPTFKLNYGLIWSLDEGMFFTSSSYKQVLDKRRGFITEVDDNQLVCAGLDIAKDYASTVLTIGTVEEVELMDGDYDIQKKIGTWIELKNADYEFQHYEICNTLIEYGVDILYADYTGVGKAVVDRMLHEIGDKVLIIPYTFSRPSKSDMWLSLDSDVKTNRLSVPANKKVRASLEYQAFEEQVLNLQKDYQGSYLVAHKSSGFKDDYCDSLGLFCLACEHDLPEAAEEFEQNPFYQGQKNVTELLKIAKW